MCPTVAEDEATGSDAACLICGSVEWWDCGHLLASIDGDYAECSGGVLYGDDRFQELFANFFVGQLARDPKVTFANPIIEEMWQDWKMQGLDPPEERSCDPYILVRLLTEAFEKNGADWDRYVIEGGPGMTQQFANFCAEKPAAVLEKAYSDCQRQLIGTTPGTLRPQ